jgi:hypothetical protein
MIRSLALIKAGPMREMRNEHSILIVNTKALRVEERTT